MVQPSAFAEEKGTRNKIMQLKVYQLNHEK